MGLGRRDWVWGALYGGSGIILTPGILLLSIFDFRGAIYIVISLVASFSLRFNEPSVVGLAVGP